MLIHLILAFIQISFSQLIQKLDIGELSLKDPAKVARISSTFKNIFLIGKFNKFPIFELNTKLNSWVSNCEFCKMENWDLSDPEIHIYPDHWENSTLFISALVFNNSIKSIPFDSLKLEFFEFPYCPSQCNENGKCDKTCKCVSGHAGYKCNTPISELSDDSKRSGTVPGFSWKFFQTKLEEPKSFIKAELSQSGNAALYFYLSPSKNLAHFPSMTNSKNEISFKETKKITARYFVQQKYMLWSIFCAQAQSCEYTIELEIGTKRSKNFFLFVSTLSTVLVTAVVTALYYLIKLLKKLKNKYLVLTDSARVITQSDMEYCFPRYFKIERDIGEQKCCICLTDFDDKAFLRTLGCIHSFHAACIDQWTVEHRLCPLCKKEIFFSDKRKIHTLK